MADFKYLQLDAEPAPEVYMAYQRSPAIRTVRVVIRTAHDPRAVAQTVRQLVTGIDVTQPVYQVQTLEQALSNSISPRRFNLFLLIAFAGSAVLLALVGIYGVTTYSVSQRIGEIGLRIALGANTRDIIWLVLWHAMRVVLDALLVGGIVAVTLSTVMASLLYGVKPDDPLTFAFVALALASTSLLACFGPALKAALTDPNEVLRYE